jgi:hypothetical protein
MLERGVVLVLAIAVLVLLLLPRPTGISDLRAQRTFRELVRFSLRGRQDHWSCDDLGRRGTAMVCRPDVAGIGLQVRSRITRVLVLGDA